MSKKMTATDAVELVKKYSEEMPSKAAAKVLNDMAQVIFVKKEYDAFSSRREGNDIYALIASEAENPTEKFESEDEADKAVTNHPKRYLNKSGIEAIDIIELFTSGITGGAAFNLGTAVKYLARLGKKTKNVQEEWKKVKWYMDRLIDAENVEIQ
ncbi:DUF3310 domain-containing protein [Treponema sp.]|uniref:DUF3310 domain-containing protein n=1 Tax=Treponema sp. TaxID=166 RepID=UPI00388D9CE3